MAQPGGQGGEHAVKGEHQGHGLGHAAGGLEGIAPVQGEVPQHRQGQGDEIAGPVAPGRQLVEQGEGRQLDDPRGEGEEEKLDGAQDFLAVHGARPFSIRSGHGSGPGWRRTAAGRRRIGGRRPPGWRGWA